jgi:transcriptional regulator with XRE-family HTH domain
MKGDLMKAEMILAKNLKAYRKKHNLSQAALSRMAGLTTRGYSKIEMCHNGARMDTLDKLAAATGLTVAQLLTDDGE